MFHRRLPIEPPTEVGGRRRSRLEAGRNAADRCVTRVRTALVFASLCFIDACPSDVYVEAARPPLAEETTATFFRFPRPRRAVSPVPYRWLFRRGRRPTCAGSRPWDRGRSSP